MFLLFCFDLVDSVYDFLPFVLGGGLLQQLVNSLKGGPILHGRVGM
jgi:hypothetical protein